MGAWGYKYYQGDDYGEACDSVLEKLEKICFRGKSNTPSYEFYPTAGLAIEIMEIKNVANATTVVVLAERILDGLERYLQTETGLWKEPHKVEKYIIELMNRCKKIIERND